MPSGRLYDGEVGVEARRKSRRILDEKEGETLNQEFQDGSVMQGDIGIDERKSSGGRPR